MRPSASKNVFAVQCQADREEMENLLQEACSLAQLLELGLSSIIKEMLLNLSSAIATSKMLYDALFGTSYVGLAYLYSTFTFIHGVANKSVIHTYAQACVPTCMSVCCADGLRADQLVLHICADVLCVLEAFLGHLSYAGHLFVTIGASVLAYHL